jgi:hypothetical protein
MKYLATQLGELGIAYLLSAVGMLVALWLSRADRRAYWRWPVYSAMALAMGVISWNLLRKHVFPAAWLADPGLLYWGALAMYVLLGLSLGLLLGRITRRPRFENEGAEAERAEGEDDERK